ncbi:MAG: NACHT domain-containing protein [Microcoleus vaginatus WJT46-NPBG5]|jgi:predicted NACHT family NTPase|nr:NACHT domain-containing protein [Microcoleus vaginatus WJT46-NPBG5]
MQSNSELASTPPASASDKQSFRNRQQLLTAVKNEVTARLQQSLHNAVLVNLGEDQQPQPVRPDVDVKIAKQPRFRLQPSDSILTAFDQAGGKLLILGAPGSGKTTTQLELAKELCDLAEQDSAAKVPVLLHLSGWNEHEQPLAGWLVNQLKYKYGVRVEIAQNWLENGQLLLLFDGLNELELSQQEDCIQAINKLLKKNPQLSQLVVCTRFEDYKKCNCRLRLKGAIFLRPFNSSQIRNYLMAARSRELWYNIETDRPLMALAKTPLFLNMMALAYEEILIHSWKRLTSNKERRQYLFNAYIRRQLGRDINLRKQPTPEQSRYWLMWLAKRLEEENQTEFFLEKMPPNWLKTPDQQRLYQIGGALMGGFIPGFSGVRQFVLRFILWRHGYIPWNYARFLDYATKQLFLQRIGKRYRFTHKLLQEHFALMSDI